MHDDGNEGKRWLFTMKKLKGVIVGCGGIAREHLAAVADLPNVEIAALCDISAARAEAMAERFGIAAWYTSYEELLANVRPDLVHITTTPSAHFPIARACLSSGLNVLCEKPITIDYSEFCVLKQLALSQNCILMENQNFRFHSSVRRVFDLFEAGKLGDILDVQVCISLNIFSSEVLTSTKIQLIQLWCYVGALLEIFSPILPTWPICVPVPSSICERYGQSTGVVRHFQRTNSAAS